MNHGYIMAAISRASRLLMMEECSAETKIYNIASSWGHEKEGGKTRI